jgi:hypothetical protein
MYIVSSTNDNLKETRKFEGVCVKVGVHVCVLGWAFMCVRLGVRVYVVGWAFIYVC